MQNCTVMSFRKRLKKRGYYNISIKKNKNAELYVISAYEPLSNQLITTSEVDILYLYNSFRF